MPARTSSSLGVARRPTDSDRASRSTEMSWVTFATDGRGSPVSRPDRATLPGVDDHLRLLVRGTQTTVRSALRLNASDWTTTTGRRKPGPEPDGSGRSAHQTSPWAITTLMRPGFGTQQPWRSRPVPPLRRGRPSPGRSTPLAHRARGGLRTRGAPRCRPRSAIGPPVGRSVRFSGRCQPGTDTAHTVTITTRQAAPAARMRRRSIGWRGSWRRRYRRSEAAVPGQPSWRPRPRPPPRTRARCARRHRKGRRDLRR